MFDLYRKITDEIVTELKTGTRPWVKSWSCTPGLNVPCNAITGRPYRGVNLLLLWTARRHDWQPRFLTFKQALEAGGHVRKGEHGHHVVFVKDLVKRESEEDEPTKFRMMKCFTVFNIAQCDKLPEALTAPPKPPNPDQRDALALKFRSARPRTGPVTIKNSIASSYPRSSSSGIGRTSLLFSFMNSCIGPGTRLG
jgi:antirestriction protein ArdC